MIRGLKFTTKGGSGSGHHGHAGRPGSVGGSVPSSGTTAISEIGRQPITGTPIETFLLRGEEEGINSSVVVAFDDGSEAIFKDDEGMIYGDYHAEVLAYELSESLGLGIVPYTEETIYEGKVGSMQKWIPDSQTASELGKAEEYELVDQIYALDRLTDNGDRHGGNIIQDSSGKIWAIDNGGCFGFGQEKYEELSINTLRGTPISKKIKTWLQTPAKDKFISSLRKSLGDEVVGIFLQRAEMLAGG